MATLAKLLVQVGVRLDGALKAETKIKRLKGATKAYGAQTKKSTEQAERGWRGLVGTIQRGALKARNSLSNLVERLGGMRHLMLGAGAAATAGAAALGGFVKSQVGTIDATNKLATSLGIGVEELQRLQFAAGQSGATSEQLSGAMRRFNTSLLDLRTKGTGPAAEAFERLGMRVEDLDGLSRTQQLGVIGDALNGVTDQAERTALAAKIFGEEAGPKLATMLAAGSDGLAELTSQARNVFTQDEADRASELADRMGELEGEIAQVSTVIAVELLPMARDIVVGTSEWIRENETFIRQDLPAFLRMISDELREAWNAVNAVADAVGWLTDKFSGLTGESDIARAAIDGVGEGFWTMLNPIAAVINAVNELTNAMEELGLVSRTLDNKIASGIDAVRDRAAREAKRRDKKFSAGSFVSGGGASGVPLSLRRPASVGSSGGGGGGRPRRAIGAGSGENADDVASSVTADEVIGALLYSGGPNRAAILRQRLQGLASSTPSTKSIKPTTAIDMTMVHNEVSIEQNITTDNPEAAGREAARAIKTELGELTARAGLSVGNKLVR